MNRKRKWTSDQLKEAVKGSGSVRQVLAKLGLREAGGNYYQIRKYINELGLEIKHFHGMTWNKGLKLPGRYLYSMTDLLIADSSYQSFKLKQRLFHDGIKKPQCEECGWCEKSPDGRVPLELDHINGNNRDNRLENLRVLCPNCHSLKPTHRGRNRKKKIGSVAE
ncbi:MAG: HNH endonuclease signature motif containing protein [bacterium]|nr:HNH endonuclease signature motif containing protein [bacterium]